MSRELDVKVAKAMGQEKPPTLHKPYWSWWPHGDGTWSGSMTVNEPSTLWPPFYSSYIAAAWELVDLMHAEDAYVGVGVQQREVLCDVTWGNPNEPEAMEVFRIAKTAPEAICLAFLAWKEEADAIQAQATTGE